MIFLKQKKIKSTDKNPHKKRNIFLRVNYTCNVRTDPEIYLFMMIILYLFIYFVTWSSAITSCIQCIGSSSDNNFCFFFIFLLLLFGEFSLSWSDILSTLLLIVLFIDSNALYWIFRTLSSSLCLRSIILKMPSSRFL